MTGADEFDGIEIVTAEPVRLGVIWLHGLGADGQDFAPIVPELALPAGVRFVFPHAPRRPVTINGGLVMRAWYDILGFGADAPEDVQGINDSTEFLLQLIDRELACGLAAEQIVLAGFSQGGAIALHAGLHTTHAIAGIIALSTYLPLANSHRDGISQPMRAFMAHGLDDPVIPVVLAERSRDRLIALGLDVEWHAYRMGHTVCLDEIVHLGRWLGRCLVSE